MKRTSLVFGIAAVFAGLTVALVIQGFVYTPLLFAVAAPFALTTYLLWYHASGRLSRRVRRRGRRRRAAGGPNRDARRGPRDGRRRADVDDSPRPIGEAYRALDLEPGADQEAIRRAYREKVKRVHPDREGGSEEAFKRVNRAYERLQEEA